MAREASLLQQELNELLAMRDEERDAMLKEAQQTVEQVLRKAFELTSGPERIAYLTSLDAETQRLIALKKLWDKRHQRNTIEYNLFLYYGKQLCGEPFALICL